MPDLSLWVRDFPHYGQAILAQHEPGSGQQCPVCHAKVGDGARGTLPVVGGGQGSGVSGSGGRWDIGWEDRAVSDPRDLMDAQVAAAWPCRTCSLPRDSHPTWLRTHSYDPAPESHTVTVSIAELPPADGRVLEQWGRIVELMRRSR
jgi:hypothetical protein